MIYGNVFLDEISLDLVNIEESADAILQEAKKDPNSDIKTVIDKSNKSNEEVEKKTNGLMAAIKSGKKKIKKSFHDTFFPWYQFALDIIPCYAENVQIYFDYDLGKAIKEGKVETEDQLKDFLAKLEENIDTMFPKIIMKKNNTILKEYFGEKGMNASEFCKKLRGLEDYYKKNKLYKTKGIFNKIKKDNNSNENAKNITKFRQIVSNEKFHYQIMGIDYETIYEYKSTHDFSSSYITHYKSLIKKMVYDVEKARSTINKAYSRIVTRTIESRIARSKTSAKAAGMLTQQAMDGNKDAMNAAIAANINMGMM